METPKVVPERVLDRSTSVIHVEKKVLHAPGEIGEGATSMWQNDLQIRILVERAGIDELACQEGVLDRSVDSSGQVRRSHGPAAAKRVGHAIHLVEDDRIL